MAWTPAQKRRFSARMKVVWAARKAGKSTVAKPKASKGPHRCARCGRSFAMAAHLGRHVTTMHGKAPTAGRPGRPPKVHARKPRNAARKPVAGVSLTLDDLVAQRREIDRQLAELLGVANPV
jgi:hypothetical protein